MRRCGVQKVANLGKALRYWLDHRLGVMCGDVKVVIGVVELLPKQRKIGVSGVHFDDDVIFLS